MLERIRDGDEEALRSLLEEAWAPLVAHLRSFSVSADIAEDLAQEAFVRLWERRDRWTDGTARGLVFRIGRNLVRDHHRRARVRWRHRELSRSVPPLSPPTPAEVFVGGETAERVLSELERLPERQREVVELVRLRGLSYADAAAALGVSSQTVANQLSRALVRLRLAAAGPEGKGGRQPRGVQEAGDGDA